MPPVLPRFPKSEPRLHGPYSDPYYSGPRAHRSYWTCDRCGCDGYVAHALTAPLLDVIRLVTKDHDAKCPRDMLTRRVYYKDDRGRRQEAIRRHHGLESIRISPSTEMEEYTLS